MRAQDFIKLYNKETYPESEKGFNFIKNISLFTLNKLIIG
jgi:hypothetical protein